MNKTKKHRRRLVLLLAAAAALAAALGAVSFAAGTHTINCPNCGDTTAEQLPSSTTKATCTEAYHWDYLCDTCGETVVVHISDALGHLWRDTVVAPGCESEGYTQRECIRIGCDAEEKTDALPASGHTWVTYTIRPVKCETDGEEETKCSVCGKSSGKLYPPATGHNWSQLGTPATCTEAGTDLKVCLNCYSATDEVPVDALGHDWDGGQETVQAGCLTQGTLLRTCRREGCGQTLQEQTDALGHDLRHVSEVPAGEETEGTAAHWKCERCGLLFLDAAGTEKVSENDLVLPATGHTHQFEDETVAPTCTEDGFTRHTCSSCGAVEKDALVSALGHNMQKVPEVPPTEEAEGRKEHWKCERCGLLFADESGSREVTDAELVLPRTEHVHEFSVRTADPTCTEGGYTMRTCPACGLEVRENETLPLGHDLEAVPERPATEESAGTKAHWKCRRCGALFLTQEAEQAAEPGELVIPRKEHVHDFTDEVTAPTCTESGFTKHTCRTCGHTETDAATEPLGHRLVHMEERPPTEEAEGVLEHWKCSRCGQVFLDADGKTPTDEESLIIPRTEHEHSFEDKVHEPSCEEPGYTEHMCSCGETVRDELTEPLGHDLEHVEEQPPSEEEEGVAEHWRCRRCGSLFEDAAGTVLTDLDKLKLPRLEHRHDFTDIVVAPTCTEDGFTKHVCSLCGAQTEDEVTPATGHQLAYTPRKEPTKTSSGNREYWQCTACGKYFADSQGKRELDPDSIVLPALGGGSVGTGDSEDAWVWIVFTAAAAAVAVLIVLRTNAAGRRKARG